MASYLSCLLLYREREYKMAEGSSGRWREKEIEVSSNMGKLKVSGVGEKNHYNDNTI